MGLLDGRVVFITGGARGQGREHALWSANEGADVVVTDICANMDTVPYPLSTQAELDETVRLVEKVGGRAIGVTADVRSQRDMDDAVARAMSEFGRVDALIANAGILSLDYLWTMSERVWQDMLDVNLTGVWHTVKAVMPHMIEQRSGSIVLTSSNNADDPDETIAHYSAAKAGVIMLMKTIALEGAQYGIRCNAIKPGFINSPMTSWQGMLDLYAGHEGGTDEDMRHAGYSFNALPTPMQEPDASARVALFLNSDLASHVTGQHFFVDSGHSILPRTNMNAVVPPASA